MTEAKISSAAEKLERLLVSKGVYLKGVEEQVTGFIDDLKRAAAFLRQLENEGEHGHVMSLSTILGEANITIDTFISDLESSTKKLKGWPLRHSAKIPPSTVRLLNDFRKEVKSIQNRIAAVRTDHFNDGRLTALVESRTAPGPPRIREEDVVGLEKEVKLLLNEAIFRRDRRLFTLYILGMGGIGKTTLAWLLYNHVDVAPQFEIRAWVNVSAALTVKEMLIELIRELGTEDELEKMMRSDEDGLRRMVSRHLDHKAYFIVLDDVWYRNHLESVIPAFPLGGHNSVLVITSRNGNRIRTRINQYFHEMNILDPSNSWELFLKNAFIGNEKCPKHLEKLGKQIVRKCNGLPLAIQEAGTKLSKRTQSEREWGEFLETMDLSETSASLELSFNRLSPRLKLCFLSLCFFKEGTTIRADKLVQLWMAGLVSQQNKEDHMDEKIGRQCLNELIGLYLVQVKDRTTDYKVKNCDINYNLHRLAVKKVNEKITITKEGSSFQSSRTSRNRVVLCSREKFNYSTNRNKYVFSLFFQGGGNFDASSSYWKSFELLKILDFEGFGLKILPETVDTLSAIKYLGLRDNFLQELPPSLYKLRSLEVLDIAQNFMIEVPNIMWKLSCLRHLYMSDIICWKPLKIDKLCSLQTLTYISIDNWIYEASDLETMTNLRKLGIKELDENSKVNKLFPSLSKLEKLEQLILRGFRFRSMPEWHELHILYDLKQLKLDGYFKRLPSASIFPPNIEYLCLTNCCLDDDPMPKLEKLSMLYYLKLKNAYTGQQMMISRRGFKKLEILCVEELWHLRNVQIGEGALPRLGQLEIRSCPYLKTLSEEIGLMRNLKELKMVTTKNIATKIRESSFISKIHDLDIKP